jgi:hypothetical protein
MNAEIVKLIGALGAAFPNTQLSAPTIKVYVSMLEDIPVEVLTVAVEQSIADCEFLPTVRALRDIAFKLTSELSSQPTAGEAWGMVKKEIERSGFYRKPHFEEPLIERTVERMGWRELCSSENPVADRAHFMKFYESLLGREIENAKLLPAARSLRQSSAANAFPSETADERLLANEAPVH